jgi:very-short-patch-repair endonuclease
MRDIKLGDGVPRYIRQKFDAHLNGHSISFEKYLEDYCGVIAPLCPCGCGLRVGVNKSKGSSARFCTAIRGHVDTSSENWKKGMERLSAMRKGEGNPRFGQKPWNDGKTKETSESMMVVSQKMTGRNVSDETKSRQSSSAKSRTVHGHTGFKHSYETIALLRKSTIDMIRRGAFTHLISKPHIAMSLLLDEIGVAYSEEKSIEFFSFDFYLNDYDVYIEVDGDYFHSNPIKYPNGPQTKTQKINYYRDIKKNKFCAERGIKLLRFWETNILGHRDDVRSHIQGELACIVKR